MGGFGFPLVGWAATMRDMRLMRGVGAAVAGCAAVVLVSGCGGGGGSDGAKPSTPPVTSAAPEPVPSDTEVVYPPGPEGDLDRLADENGWQVSDETASAYVQNMCDSLGHAVGVSPEQWLKDGQMDSADDGAALKAGVPKLCPKWTKTVNRAVSGDFDRWFSDGTYDVKKGATVSAGSDENQVIPPGTYRTSGDLADCYWERTSQGGDILDNGFATAARRVMVTVRAGELFTVRDCGTWKPAK